MIMDIYVQALKKISPLKKDEEEMKKFVDELVRIAKTITGLDSVICGSIGKLTWLKGDHDIDLFLLFPNVSRQELEKKGLEYGKKISAEMKGKPVIKYAEHPYVHTTVKGYDIDIVPCYRIKKGEKIKSAVDRSPLHMEYVLETLKPDLRNDVRLLKQFMKGAGVYGSDAKNLGFSGYICELLVINYGTFESVLKAVSKWEVPEIIFVEIHLQRKINTKEEYPNHPLIVIDPTDEKRNAAAVVSAGNFYKFKEKASQYLKNPSIGFFFPAGKKCLSVSQINELKKRGTKFITLELKKPDIVDDILYPQARRLLKRTETLLEHNEFRCMRSYEHIGKNIYLIFELEIWELPPVKRMVGPHIFAKEHVNQFRNKYTNAFVHENVWTAEKDREYRKAIDLLEKFVRVAKNEDGVPSKLIEEFKNAKLYEHSKFWSLVRKNKGLSVFLNEKYF